MKIRSNFELEYLRPWIELRSKIETSSTPFEDTSGFFERLPKTKFYTDPYDQSNWPNPWELILENIYCPFNTILGICYTLKLTERFKDLHPKINLAVDTSNKTVYNLLIIDDKVYGYQIEDWCTLKDLPKSLITKKMYSVDSLQ